MVSDRGDEWVLILAGSSIVRVEETARMVVPLHKHNIPFILHEGEEILSMVTVKDYIGIVPDHVFPRYCHGLFPKKDQIIDFMNLGSENQDSLIRKMLTGILDHPALGRLNSEEMEFLHH